MLLVNARISRRSYAGYRRLRPFFGEVVRCFDLLLVQTDRDRERLLDLGAAMEIVEKRGAFYTFEGTRLGQGRENAKEFLEKSPEISQRIEAAIRSASVLTTGQVIEQPEDETDEEME